MGILDFFKFGGDKINKQLNTHIKALKHSSFAIRSEAVKALGELGSSRYLIHVDDMFGQFITNVWRIEGGKDIQISDSSVNPMPTEGDTFILSLTRTGTSLPLAAMPVEGLKDELR